jgi:hydroxymethylpyrimidine/phosphomethylpyrimidine kinase
MTGRVLVVAGSDSSAGAGIQADIKTIAALGGYATTAITALTAQNTLGVDSVLAVPAAFVRRQMEAVLDDIGADCIKTGMLHDAAVIDAVIEIIEVKAGTTPLVVDPVMISTSGTRLLDADAVAVLKRRLLPRTTVLTPNVPEAEALTGLTLSDLDAMKRAAQALRDLGARYVVLKGGHLPGPIVHDVFCGEGEMIVIDSARIETRHTHGTGCTLASAIAAGLAQGLAPLPAMRRARDYLSAAIRHAPGLGKGHGPLGHMHVLHQPAK